MSDTANKTAQQAAEASVLVALRKAGGGNVNRDDLVTRRGNEYVIPERSTLTEAAEFLLRVEREQEQPAEFKRVFSVRPLDGAYCASRAMREVFGALSHRGQMGFFGPEPPAMIDVEVNVGETVQVPWGVFQLPCLPNTSISFHGINHPEKGSLFAISVEAPKKFAAEIEGLFKLIEDACKTYSIYKGKAFDGGFEFFPIDIDPAKVVYSGDAEVQLQANIWSCIEDADLQREAGLPLKRAVLVHGPYGTGKTLSIGLTAQKAVKHGWTFIRCRPGKDSYEDALRTAALYAPSVVAIEDVDTTASADASGVDVSRLLDLADGLTSKGKEIITLLTSNHPEKIHKGMVRPGRLDAVIEIAALDHAGIEKLIKVLVPEQLLAADIDWPSVCQAMEGYMPAFIKEATDRATRYAISRIKSLSGITIDSEDLINAAQGLRPQLALMESATDHHDYEPPLDRSLRKLVNESLYQMLDGRVLDSDPESQDRQYGQT